jgi:hypothetical protein
MERGKGRVGGMMIENVYSMVSRRARKRAKSQETPTQVSKRNHTVHDATPGKPTMQPTRAKIRTRGGVGDV